MEELRASVCSGDLASSYPQEGRTVRKEFLILFGQGRKGNQGSSQRKAVEAITKKVTMPKK